MRPLGFSGAPSLLIDAGSGATLRAGVSVSVTVLDRASPGLYRILAGGQVLMARSEVHLETGAILKARVEKLPGLSGLLLRLEPQARPEGATPARLDALLSSFHLPVDAGGRLAAAALLAEGLAPTQASILRVKRAFSAAAGAAGKDEGEGGSAEARIAARMEAKGLGASPEAIVELSAASEGRQGLGQGGSDRKGEDRKGQGGAKPGGESGGVGAEQGPDLAGRTATGDGTLPAVIAGVREENLAAESLPEVLGAFLKKICQASAEGTGSSSSPILGLFNHARAEAGGSLIVPFRFALDSVAFAGSFHILLPYIAGGPGRIEARFRTGRNGLESLDDGSSACEWGFDLAFGSGCSRLVLRKPGSARAAVDAGTAFESMVKDLAVDLRASGCDVSIAEGAGVEEGEGVDLDA